MSSPVVSRFMRRSGIAAGLICHHLNWRPDLVVQVGVGLAHHEVETFQREWPDVEFVGFEPHPEIHQMLKDYPGVLHQQAVANHVGEVLLHYSWRHKDGSSLFPYELEKKSTSCTVPVTTLDEWWRQWIHEHRLIGQDGSSSSSPRHREILLWLDCEGSELSALQGAREFLAYDWVGMVNVELTSKPVHAGWCTTVDVHRHLVARGFWLQWLHTQRTSAGQCDAIYVRRELFRPEYCCVPQEIELWNS